MLHFRDNPELFPKKKFKITPPPRAGLPRRIDWHAPEFQLEDRALAKCTIYPDFATHLLDEMLDDG
jgi:hypothetical protein